MVYFFFLLNLFERGGAHAPVALPLATTLLALELQHRMIPGGCSASKKNMNLGTRFEWYSMQIASE